MPRARARVLRTTTKRTRTRERKARFRRVVDVAPAAQPERKGLAQRGWRCEGQRARAGGAAQTHYELYKPVNRVMRYRESHRKKCTRHGTARQRADGQPMRTPTSTIVMSWMMYRTADSARPPKAVSSRAHRLIKCWKSEVCFSAIGASEE